MTLLLVFVGCVFTILALRLTILPFLGGAQEGVRLEYLDEEVREIELLVARRQVLLTALRELEFDHETSKVADEDYQRFHARYEREAVAILRRLDEIHGGRGWQAKVDAELTERLGRPPQLGATSNVATGDEEPEEEAAEEVAEPTTGAAAAAVDESSDGVEAVEDVRPDAEATTDEALCSGCGEPLAADDKFCSQCGTPTAATGDPTQEPAKSEASA